MALEPGGRGRGCHSMQGTGVKAGGEGTGAKAGGEVLKAFEPSDHAVGRRNPAGGRGSAGAWRWVEREAGYRAVGHRVGGFRAVGSTCRSRDSRRVR